jgi:hypothetical protein
MGRNFPQPSRPALRPTQPSVEWIPGHSAGVKRLGRVVDHPPPSSVEVEKRVDLYFYPHLGLRLLFSGELCLSELFLEYVVFNNLTLIRD